MNYKEKNTKKKLRKEILSRKFQLPLNDNEKKTFLLSIINRLLKIVRQGEIYDGIIEDIEKQGFYQKKELKNDFTKKK